MPRLDHKHLNLDCPEFAGLNPSVEHIALVCRNLLQAPLRGAGLPLVCVTVWETAKTCATVQAAG
jgi:6-pyruvoyltetrahydropterin/6-carboxytetrahydropterin synthase